jgi:large subunit ribosomal protein L14e
MVMEIGRTCIKTAGREAGEKCVIVDIIDKTHVLVSGPNIKRRSCNVKHLEPLTNKLDITKGASDEDVKRAIESAGTLTG